MLLPEEREAHSPARSASAEARHTAECTVSYTLAADVYSVGLLLWAIGTCSFPFEQLERPVDVFRAVKGGARPPLPDEPAPADADAGAYEACCAESRQSWFGLVVDCWAQDAESRPSMEHVSAVLEAIPSRRPHTAKGATANQREKVGRAGDSPLAVRGAVRPPDTREP
jgi:hypothetical protein